MTSGYPINEHADSLAKRLEGGELIYFPISPFSLPHGEDHDFLIAQQLRDAHESAICFDPTGGRLKGYRFTTAENAERLAALMRSFSITVTGWLANVLPAYCGKWSRDRITLRTEEEATRSLRHSSRNDLLHIDNFLSRPTGGQRILRLYVNINPTEERVWITSEKFDSLLNRFRERHRLPVRTIDEWREPLRGFQRFVQGDWSIKPSYDSFVQKLQQFLRADEDFQERAPRHFWHFPPGSAWLLFADGLSHAVLRGQFALEHSYFVPENAWVLPHLAPLNQLAAAGDASQLRRAG